MDAKATVKVGPFARGGKSRVQTQAADHDFKPEAKVTPVGIFLPALDDLFLYGITSKVTSDCLVDCLVDWWETVKERFPQIKTLLINLDNGPEKHSRRTQFMKRLLEFVQHYQINVRLAYYPPYHSKYNPIERCWGILEQHWNGSLLDWVDAVLQFARTMTQDWETSSGRIGDKHLSDWHQIDAQSYASGGNPPSAIAPLGEVVCGYQVFFDS
jgi:hypothetical protein